VTLTRGRHQLSFGAWFQRFQSNENIALSQFGQATFSSLAQFLSGTVNSFLYNPSPTPLSWRSLFGAFHAEDVIRLSPKLTLSLGFRDEFSTGWNEAYGRAANYTFTNGVINTQPQIGSALFTTNNAKFLPQPRIGVVMYPGSNDDRDALWALAALDDARGKPVVTVMPVMTKLNGGRQLRIPREAGYDGEVFEVGALG